MDITVETTAWVPVRPHVESILRVLHACVRDEHEVREWRFSKVGVALLSRRLARNKPNPQWGPWMPVQLFGIPIVVDYNWKSARTGRAVLAHDIRIANGGYVKPVAWSR